MRVLLSVIFLSCLAFAATVERGSLPDPKLTPGDTLGVTTTDICTPLHQKIRREDASKLDLDFADGSTRQIILAGATSSVMVRDKGGKLEYAD
jgi:hypothetical protein